MTIFRKLATILSFSLLLSLWNQNAYAESSTANAIVSEGNGAAVFIGYGGDRTVDLSWRPAKKYENDTMLYQIQRSDGAMLESKTRSSSFTDKNLQPNTFYGYELTVYQTKTTNVTVKGKLTQKMSINKIGSNTIRVLTLPSMVVNLRADLVRFKPDICGGSVELTWELPEHSTNNLKYSVRLDGNVMAYGIPMRAGRYSIESIGDKVSNNSATCTKYYNFEVVVENETGPARTNARLTSVRFV